MLSIFPINHICVKRINLSTRECVSVVLLWAGVCGGHTTRHLTIVVLFSVAICTRQKLPRPISHLVCICICFEHYVEKFLLFNIISNKSVNCLRYGECLRPKVFSSVQVIVR